MNLTRLINQNSENLPSSHSGPGTGQHPGLPAHHARLTAAALHRSAHLVHGAHHQSVGHNRLAWDDGLMAHQTIIGRICCCMPCWLCIDTMVLFMSPDKFMGAICIWRGWPPIETPPHELCSELLIVVMLSLMMLLCGGTTLPPPICWDGPIWSTLPLDMGPLLVLALLPPYQPDSRSSGRSSFRAAWSFA